jgi:hypothetical protein
VVEKYSGTGGIAASFFFSRSGGDGGHLRHAGRFVTSIAVQLANNKQPLKQTICDAISAHSDIANRALHEQWRHLVVGPLSQLVGSSSPSRYILVIDALDECEDENNIQIILQLLAESQWLEGIKLRVFLTSRPEVPIRNGFVQMPDAEHQDFVLHNISSSVIDHDIRIFLEHNLKLVAQSRALVVGWPGEQTIKQLVQKASGLFIWAATACRFISEGKIFAAKRLKMILEHSSAALSAPETHLNEIYTTVLHHCISPDYSDEESDELRFMLKSLLGTIATLLTPLSTLSLSRLALFRVFDFKVVPAARGEDVLGADVDVKHDGRLGFVESRSIEGDEMRTIVVCLEHVFCLWCDERWHIFHRVEDVLHYNFLWHENSFRKRFLCFVVYHFQTFR